MKKTLLAILLGLVLALSAMAQNAGGAPNSGFSFDVYGDSSTMSLRASASWLAL
jgi:hypothetical protein